MFFCPGRQQNSIINTNHTHMLQKLKARSLLNDRATRKAPTKAFSRSESLRLTADSNGAFACIEGGMRTSAA